MKGNICTVLISLKLFFVDLHIFLTVDEAKYCIRFLNHNKRTHVHLFPTNCQFSWKYFSCVFFCIKILSGALLVICRHFLHIILSYYTVLGSSGMTWEKLLFLKCGAIQILLTIWMRTWIFEENHIFNCYTRMLCYV